MSFRDDSVMTGDDRGEKNPLFEKSLSYVAGDATWTSIILFLWGTAHSFGVFFLSSEGEKKGEELWDCVCSCPTRDYSKTGFASVLSVYIYTA